jgi:hypothetical protein
MPSPPRYTFHHYAVTDRSYVFDRLLYRRVLIQGSGGVAARMARDYEADWRRHCERWIEAEHRESLP